jgi:hypothetical protein
MRALMNSILISDEGRAPICAQRRDSDGLLLHARGVIVALSKDEAQRLAEFIFKGTEPQSVTPAKARWAE